MNPMVNLENRFRNTISLYSQEQNLIRSLWLEINDHYTEKHRTYHNKTHLIELLNYFDTYNEQVLNPTILELSIFYHHIIYNVWKKNNEEKSALLAINKLAKINLAPTDLILIQQQILATKTHFTEDNDTKWLIDFNLGILGKPYKTYQNCAQLIRKEYKLIPQTIYKKRRKKVLTHFIQKSFIYATDSFRNLYEKQAKSNLINELNSL
ncbi:HD domain-containing protein [Tenacibaculum maritimum]|uniref:HD domain-containing protein n=1 Tax=Tenacibaculum maritimum TaxID=107401 RepID=UPI0038775DA1